MIQLLPKEPHTSTNWSPRESRKEYIKETPLGCGAVGGRNSFPMSSIYNNQQTNSQVILFDLIYYYYYTINKRTWAAAQSEVISYVT
jgi:hypothetical protein